MQQAYLRPSISPSALANGDLPTVSGDSLSRMTSAGAARTRSFRAVAAFATLGLLFYKYRYIQVFSVARKLSPVPFNAKTVDAEILSKFLHDARIDDTDTATRFTIRCSSMRNNSAIIGGGAEVFRYLHIPKTGGANVEKFLGLNHQTHTRLALQPKDNRKQLLLTIRHPVERLQSSYYFIKAGEGQRAWKNRQSHFCVNGTGKATNTECIPKQSFYEFAMSEVENLENVYLRTNPRLIPEFSESVGSVANFQTKWLSARGAGTLREIKERVLNDITLLGDTRNLQEFKYMLARVYYGDSDAEARSRTCKSIARVNETPHPPLESDLSEEQYRLVAERNSVDIRLYYFVVKLVAAQRACFGLHSPFSCTD